MNNKTILLIIGSVLVGIGILRPDLSSVFKPNNPNSVVVDNVNYIKPESKDTLEKCNNVIKALSHNNDRKFDGKRLASLYNDIANLIELDGTNEIIKNTEEIRQANKLSGLMLQLDINGKYPDLASANEQLIISTIGDDHIVLNSETRAKAAEGFRALAWACYEGSK